MVAHTGRTKGENTKEQPEEEPQREQHTEEGPKGETARTGVGTASMVERKAKSKSRRSEW